MRLHYIPSNPFEGLDQDFRKQSNQNTIAFSSSERDRVLSVILALEAGIEVKDVAVLVGNSPDVIHRHYAARKPISELPEL